MQLPGDIRAERIALVSRVVDNTVLIQDVAGNGIIAFVVGTVHVQVVLLRESRFKHLVLPADPRVFAIPIVLRGRRVSGFTGVGIYRRGSRIRELFIGAIIFIEIQRGFVPV